MAGVYATEMYTKELKRVLDDYLERVASLAVGVAPPPLLLYVAPNNVHTPTAAPDRFVNKYNTSIASSSRRTFSGDVSALDEFVANCTTALITRGLWSNATMIFSTDNGGNLHGGGNNWYVGSSTLAPKCLNDALPQCPVFWGVFCSVPLTLTRFGHSAPNHTYTVILESNGVPQGR